MSFLLEGTYSDGKSFSALRKRINNLAWTVAMLCLQRFYVRRGGLRTGQIPARVLRIFIVNLFSPGFQPSGVPVRKDVKTSV